jgi:hypothetical protein
VGLLTGLEALRVGDNGLDEVPEEAAGASAAAAQADFGQAAEVRPLRRES